MHFLRRLIVRNDNHRAISPHPSNHSKPDTSVTGGPFNDCCTRCKPALPFRPAKGDRVLEPTSETIWVVSEIRPEGDGRAVLDLNLLARP